MFKQLRAVLIVTPLVMLIVSLSSACSGGGDNMSATTADAGAADVGRANDASDGSANPVDVVVTDVVVVNDAGADVTSDGGGVSACPSTRKVSDQPKCDACVKAKCCTQIVACDDNADCVAFLACVAACSPNDDTCGLQCSLDHEEGTLVVQQLNNCATDKCKTECPI